MPTVPSWIAKAVVYSPRYGEGGTATPINSWRATRTQVVVTVPARTGVIRRDVEYRFRLDDLKPVGSGDRGRLVQLLAPDDRKVIAAIEDERVRSAIDAIVSAVTDRPGSAASPDRSVEAVARYATAVRDAANRALAELAEVL